MPEHLTRPVDEGALMRFKEQGGCRKCKQDLDKSLSPGIKKRISQKDKDMMRAEA